MEININISSDEKMEMKMEGASMKGDPGYTPKRGTDYWTPEDKAEVVKEATQAAAEAVKEMGTNKMEKTQFSSLGTVDLNQIFEPGLYIINGDSANLPADITTIKKNGGNVDRFFLKVSPYGTYEPTENEGIYISQRGTLQELTIMGYTDMDDTGDFSMVFVRGIDIEKDTNYPDNVDVMIYGWVTIADSRPRKDTKFVTMVTDLNQAFEPGIYYVLNTAKGLPAELLEIESHNGIMLKVTSFLYNDAEASMLQEITANFIANDTGEDASAIWTRYIFVDTANDYIDAYNWIKTADSRQITN